MIKCDCYHKEFGKERCYGTKEMEECDCGGNEMRCDFYPTKRAIAISKQKPMDILTLMRELYNKGYELKITPCSPYDNCVEIRLHDTNQSFHNIKIHMKVDEDYFKDPNYIIFETINKMIKDMDGIGRLDRSMNLNAFVNEYRKRVSNPMPKSEQADILKKSI